jgi:tetratricopeptide (TPR) repeat protein
MFKRSCLIVFMIAVCCVGRSADAQDQAPGPNLIDLIDRVDQIEVPGGEDWETVDLQAEVLFNAAYLACWTNDKPAMRHADKALQRYIALAQDAGNTYSRDTLMTARAELLAYEGKWEAARDLAWAIPPQAERALAYAKIAGHRARKGDRAGYERELDEALELLDQIIQVDTRRDPDEQEFVAYYAQNTLLWLIDDLVLTDAFHEQASMKELKRLAGLFEAIDLSAPARAEVQSMLAYGYAALGAKDEALTLLKRAEPALQQERERVAKLSEEDKWLAYGADFAYSRQVHAYGFLGDFDAAARTLDKIDDRTLREMTSAYLAPYHARHDQDEQAAERLKQAVDFALASHRADARDEAEDELRRDKSPVDVYWDLYVAAEVAGCLDDDAQLKRLREAVAAPVYKIAIDSGEAWGRMRWELPK